MRLDWEEQERKFMVNEKRFKTRFVDALARQEKID